MLIGKLLSVFFILRVKLFKKNCYVGGYNIPHYVGMDDGVGEGISGVMICSGQGLGVG